MKRNYRSKYVFKRFSNFQLLSTYLTLVQLHIRYKYAYFGYIILVKRYFSTLLEWGKGIEMWTSSSLQCQIINLTGHTLVWIYYSHSPCANCGQPTNLTCHTSVWIYYSHSLYANCGQPTHIFQWAFHTGHIAFNSLREEYVLVSSPLFTD